MTPDAPEEGRCVCTPDFCVGVPGDSDICKVCLALDPEIGCALDRHTPERETLANHEHVEDKRYPGYCCWTELDGEVCQKPVPFDSGETT